MNRSGLGSGVVGDTPEPETPRSGEIGTPPKRRYSLNLAMQGDGPQAMADALYDIATDLLHGSFPGQRISGGYDVGYRAELVENDPTMTHERYVEELEAYLSDRSDSQSIYEETP